MGQGTYSAGPVALWRFVFAKSLYACPLLSLDSLETKLFSTPSSMLDVYELKHMCTFVVHFGLIKDVYEKNNHGRSVLQINKVNIVIHIVI